MEVQIESKTFDLLKIQTKSVHVLKKKHCLNLIYDSNNKQSIFIQYKDF
jgi:hypothetical protein